MKVALVCIAKNEENYIDEWIKYNKKLGFDDIFIYQNDWRWSGNYDNVHKLELDGLNKQTEAYNHFIKNNLNNFDWVAFFDIDEFLVLKKHNNIKEFISEYNDFPAIGVNWVLFGNNGHTKTNGDYRVIDRFTKRQTSVNVHVKCIVKLNEGVFMGVHNPNGMWVCPNKVSNKGPFNHQGSDEIAQLNHYFCKTEEEFALKCERGRADNLIIKRTMSEFEGHNINDIEDLTAYNFLHK